MIAYTAGTFDLLHVDIFVIGEDWGNKPHNIAVESYLKTAGKKVIQVLYNPRTSSTQIKRNVMDQLDESRFPIRAIA